MRQDGVRGEGAWQTGDMRVFEFNHVHALEMFTLVYSHGSSDFCSFSCLLSTTWMKKVDCIYSNLGL